MPEIAAAQTAADMTYAKPHAFLPTGGSNRRAARVQAAALRWLVRMAALLTAAVLVFLIGYILVMGIPNLKPELFAWEYNSENVSLTPALINTVHKLRQNGQDVPAADIAASFQHAAVELLSDKAMLAAVETGAKTVALAGGVASNSGLRNTMNDKCQKAGIRLVMPPPILCTDNAAMIGSAAFYRLMRGEIAGLDLNACPSLKLV